MSTSDSIDEQPKLTSEQETELKHPPVEEAGESTEFSLTEETSQVCLWRQECCFVLFTSYLVICVQKSIDSLNRDFALMLLTAKLFRRAE